MYYTLYIWYKYQLKYKKAHAVYTSNSEITYQVPLMKKTERERGKGRGILILTA
jgi:hypothetical protein